MNGTNYAHVETFGISIDGKGEASMVGEAAFGASIALIAHLRWETNS